MSKNTVRAKPFDVALDKLRGVSHGVEAYMPLIDLRPVFRLRFPEPVLSVVEGLNTSGFRGVFQQLANPG